LFKFKESDPSIVATGVLKRSFFISEKHEKSIQNPGSGLRARRKPMKKRSCYIETFEKRSILFKFKEGENFNHRNTRSISRIKI